MKFSALPLWIKILILAVAYFFVARIGLLLSFPKSELIPLWIPTGIAIGMVFLGGRKYLVSVFLGSWGLYFTTMAPTVLSLLYAGINTLEAFIGWWLFIRSGNFNYSLRTTKDVSAFFIFSAVVNTAISALLGTIIICLANPELWNIAQSLFLSWMFGNFTGALVVAPLLFVFGSGIQRLTREEVITFVLLNLFLVAVAGYLFSGELYNYAIAYVLFPFTIWSVYRFRQLGAVVSTFLIGISAAISARTGSGVFIGKTQLESLALVDGYLIVLALLALLLAAIWSERDTVEVLLRNSEERFRAIASSITIPMCILRLEDGVILYANKHLQNFLGVTEPMQNRNIKNFYNDKRQWKILVSKVLHEERLNDFEISGTSYNGKHYTVSASAQKNFFERTPVVVVTFYDITQRKKLEQQLARSEEHFRMLIENSSDGIALVDSHARISYISPSVKKILGYEGTEINGRRVFEIIHPDDYEQYKAEAWKMLKKQFSTFSLVARLRHKNGEWVHVHSSLTNLLADPNVYGVVANISDVTQRVKDEQRIKDSLHEKQLLLSETHHRVKNNMQVISSLLHLQFQKVRSKATKEMFRESQNRVKSMALVHEILYNAERESEISLSLYVDHLIASLRESYEKNVAHITIVSDIATIVLRQDTAVLCGLILNELITNAIYHAFPGKKKGVVTISAKKNMENNIELIVKDNGVGIPNESAIKKSTTLGYGLVFALVEQLHGTISFATKKGTVISINFSDELQFKE